LGQKAVRLAPQSGTYQNTLGVVHYRAGNWQSAVETLDKSMSLRNGGDSFDYFFLAMAHWRLNQYESARRWYAKATEWMDRHRPNDDELRRFRVEAAELLETKGPKD
jgi:tetratricopeptide (TPR) repeat protein